MKVLVIVNAHFGFDGISNVAKNYYHYQYHQKIQMDIMTINNIPDSFRKEILNNGDKNFVLTNRNRNPLSYFLNLRRIISKGKYDIVHIHGNSNTMFIELWAAKLGGCKTRIAHSHNTTCNHRVINKILRPFFKMAYTDGFACGVEAGEWLFDKNEATIIANGIDLDRFSLDKDYRIAYKKELGVSNRIVIGHVGRFSVQKNHKKLLSIYKSLIKNYPNVTLLMWGEGELLEAAKEQAKNIGGDIRFMGTSNEIEKCLHAVDIIIFPSLFEGLPLFLVEAQAIGIPCLLSDTISPMTKITDYVYFKKLESSDEVWAKTALKILASSNVDENAQRSHIIIRNAGYDIRVLAQKLFEKYNELIIKNNG